MHIVFLLTDGFVARMVIRSGVAERLIANGACVTVICPNADETYFQKECDTQGLILKQAPSVSTRVAGRFRAYRPYFLDDVINSTTLTAIHGHLFKNRPFSGFTMEAINRTFAKSRTFRSLYRAVETRVNHSRRVKRLLNELRPDLVVITNPFGTETTVYLLHAKELGIPVVCEMASWDNITSKGTPLLMPDYFISWGPIMTQEMLEMYHFPRTRIYECGVPHFDVYSANGRLTPRHTLLKDFNLPPELPYLFYGMVTEMYCPNEIEILRWLTEKVNNDAFAKPCSLIIRPHPQQLSGIYSMSDKKLEQLKALAGPRVALDIPKIRSDRLAWDLPKEDMYHLASLLAGCAICLNASSTLCLDACMIDRPTVNIGFDGWESVPYQGSARQSLDFTHMAKLLAMGGIRVAKSFGELERHINTYLRDPELDHEARMLSALEECGFRDGQSAARVASVLSHLARCETVNPAKMVTSLVSEERGF
jgi:hypothetical protein